MKITLGMMVVSIVVIEPMMMLMMLIVIRASAVAILSVDAFDAWFVERVASGRRKVALGVSTHNRPILSKHPQRLHAVEMRIFLETLRRPGSFAVVVMPRVCISTRNISVRLTSDHVYVFFGIAHCSKPGSSVDPLSR